MRILLITLVVLGGWVSARPGPALACHRYVYHDDCADYDLSANTIAVPTQWVTGKTNLVYYVNSPDENGVDLRSLVDDSIAAWESAITVPLGFDDSIQFESGGTLSHSGHDVLISWYNTSTPPFGGDPDALAFTAGSRVLDSSRGGYYQYHWDTYLNQYKYLWAVSVDYESYRAVLSHELGHIQGLQDAYHWTCQDGSWDVDDDVTIMTFGKTDGVATVLGSCAPGDLVYPTPGFDKGHVREVFRTEALDSAPTNTKSGPQGITVGWADSSWAERSYKIVLRTCLTTSVSTCSDSTIGPFTHLANVFEHPASQHHASSSGEQCPPTNCIGWPTGFAHSRAITGLSPNKYNFCVQADSGIAGLGPRTCAATVVTLTGS